MRENYLNAQELVQKDIESLIPHFKSCTSCNRLKENSIYLLEKSRELITRKTFTTVCVLGCFLKLSFLLI